MVEVKSKTKDEKPEAATSVLDAFYTIEDPKASKSMREILIQYSKIPENEIISHVKAIRDKAWQVFKYPCVGSYFFLNQTIALSPTYSHVLERVKAGDKLLDLGCCFGQDVRKFVFAGAPAQNITTTDLEQLFLDLGYDLFQDRDTLETRFIAADFFAPELPDGLNEGSFDVIHAASFFHLFSRAEQKYLFTRAVGLLKRKPGSIIFGRQLGSAGKPRVDKIGDLKSGESYKHNEASWKAMVQEVAEATGMELAVECSFHDVEFQNQKRMVHWKLFWFKVTMMT
ncbi:Hypothetical protein R9X50_00465300 [Acrodontium crateriforme]|uniref:Methyltransferase domain-containing protein n=1 Tax=Acrodontium crateriforme TaxID=150365 RepID=A0AAQ3RAY6_9PEZI|nr:Hypothetical protein R9X50_00465300 [Acrodontium crateriforme]